MLLKLCYYGNPILRKHCEPIVEITDEIRALARDMIETMDANNGAGLAAPQIGRPIRMFVLRSYLISESGEWAQAEPQVYINPQLSSPGKHLLTEAEGCLSLPGLRVKVARPDTITVTATDLEGNLFTEELQDYNARLRMHENDHLNGVLHIDRIDIHTRKKIDPLLREMKKTYNP